MLKQKIRRMISAAAALLMLIGIMQTSVLDVQAEETEPKLVDGSYLTLEDSSTGYTYENELGRGTHLMDGECSITKAGRGRIYVYGSTTANHTVEFVSVLVYVDRYNEADDAWDQIDSWVAEATDDYYVSTSKTLTVDRGYFYRVHTEHFAGNGYPYESAASLTDGIKVD